MGSEATKSEYHYILVCVLCVILIILFTNQQTLTEASYVSAIVLGSVLTETKKTKLLLSVSS